MDRGPMDWQAIVQLNWRPQHQTWRLYEFSKVFKVRGSCHHPLGGTRALQIKVFLWVKEGVRERDNLHVSSITDFGVYVGVKDFCVFVSPKRLWKHPGPFLFSNSLCLNSQKLLLCCELHSFLISLYVAQMVLHLGFSSFGWLISISIWSSKARPCSDQWRDFRISGVLFYGQVIVYGKYVPHLKL